MHPVISSGFVVLAPRYITMLTVHCVGISNIVFHIIPNGTLISYWTCKTYVSSTCTPKLLQITAVRHCFYGFYRENYYDMVVSPCIHKLCGFLQYIPWIDGFSRIDYKYMNLSADITKKSWERQNFSINPISNCLVLYIILKNNHKKITLNISHRNKHSVEIHTKKRGFYV